MPKITEDQYINEVKNPTAHLNDKAGKVARILALLGTKIVMHPKDGILSTTFFFFTDGAAPYYMQIEEDGKYKISKYHRKNPYTGVSTGIVEGEVCDANITALQAFEIMKTGATGPIPDKRCRQVEYKDFNEFFDELWFKDKAIVIDLPALVQVAA